MVNPQGRVVVPVEVRRALGLGPGGRVQFVVEGDQVRLVTPPMRAMALWAKNTGGDAGDSTADLRTYRMADQERTRAAEQRIAARVAEDTRSEDELTTHLLGSLGL